MSRASACRPCQLDDHFNCAYADCDEVCHPVPILEVADRAD